MSDQQKGAGHHAITREAVAELFASLDDSGHRRAVLGDDGQYRIDSMTKQQYFDALDAAQHHQDEGLGTLTPGKWAPDLQRQHGLADPSLDGQTNLHNNEHYVLDQMDQAQQAEASSGGHDAELQHLGAAAHSLEDSYSDAHAFRASSVDSGDPHAPVESYNVFDPADAQSARSAGIGAVVGTVVAGPIGTVVGAAAGWFINNELHHDGEGTHDDRFDHVPTDGQMHPITGSDLAAAHATAEMLESYYDHRQEDHAGADTAYHATLDADFQAAPGGVAVNRDNTDPAWIAERDHRLAVRQEQVDAWSTAHQDHDQPDGGVEDTSGGSWDGGEIGDQSDE